jgi:hypothetical protein
MSRMRVSIEVDTEAQQGTLTAWPELEQDEHFDIQLTEDSALAFLSWMSFVRVFGASTLAMHTLSNLMAPLGVAAGVYLKPGEFDVETIIALSVASAHAAEKLAEGSTAVLTADDFVEATSSERE